MVTRVVAAIRRLLEEDRIEITLQPGFTPAELDVVRALPNRRYDPVRRIWSAPNVREAMATLTEAFGAGSVLVSPGPEIVPQGRTEPSSDVLERVRDALTVRGYSPRTRKVYLGHLRRFMAWCGGGRPKIPDDPAGQGQAYILDTPPDSAWANSFA